MKAKETEFWRKVERVGDCWIWNGSKDENGYGKICRGMKIIYAHRYAYQLSHGNIPKDYDVKRTCNNKLCVNTKHLYLYKYSDEEKLKIFWESFEKQKNGCWPWKGTVNTSGYGYIYLGGRVRYVRDLMWELVNGQVQGWHRVGNRCGNILCVNPDHLFLRQGRNEES